MGYFISNQHVNWKLDPNNHAFNVPDANYTYKHVTFNKGQCIGHIEPSIDPMPQTAINILTTQRMLDEHIQPDIFTPPLHTLQDDVRN